MIISSIVTVSLFSIGGIGTPVLAAESQIEKAEANVPAQNKYVAIGESIKGLWSELSDNTKTLLGGDESVLRKIGNTVKEADPNAKFLDVLLPAMRAAIPDKQDKQSYLAKDFLNEFLKRLPALEIQQKLSKLGFTL